MELNSNYPTQSTRQFSSQLIVVNLRFEWQIQLDKFSVQNALKSKAKTDCPDDYDTGIPASHNSRNEVLRNELIA